MARKTKTAKKCEDIEAYRHEADKRKNAVPVGLASYDTSKPKPKKYDYDPHLDPQLVWAGKKEHTSFEVPTVSLHIHERIAPEAIIRAIKREDPQIDLFAKPEMPLKDLVEFYQHEMDWTNRLILGDSLLVMNSLLEREMMGGKVQTIFVDPPYGVKFSSNFQPSVRQRDVKDSDEFMVREPEQIKAYRDTWELGIHSYLSYLRDRLLLSRDLLTDSGSIFVQISDENVHHVRELMDEVFGSKNFVSFISFATSTGRTATYLDSVYDRLLWYGKNIDELKFRQLFNDKSETDDEYPYSDEDGNRFTLADLSSQHPSPTRSVAIKYNNKTYYPPSGRQWAVDPSQGFQRLVERNRVYEYSDKQLRFKKYHDDYPVSKINNTWVDTQMGAFAGQKVYVVQTNTKVIQRCILMTTDPGDLVLDPTCGSGTSAHVAEQWGRRWITCDTSRVALTLARQRLMTSVYPYYKMADQEMGVKGGFIYEEVPHVTLKSIANNEQPDKEILFDKPQIDKKRIRVSGPFTVEGIPQHSSYESEIPDLKFEKGDKESEIRDSASQISNVKSQIPVEADNHVHTLIELFCKDGVTFPGNKKMKFENLIPVSSGFIHAEGTPLQDLKSDISDFEMLDSKSEISNLKSQILHKVAVSFGPPHGPVTVRQVEDGIHDAYLSGYDAVIFCGFAFDAAAHNVKHPKIKVFYSHIRPDVLMGDLLKTTTASQLFTVFGEPDIEITPPPSAPPLKVLIFTHILGYMRPWKRRIEVV